MRPSYLIEGKLGKIAKQNSQSSKIKKTKQISIKTIKIKFGIKTK
jgi:hypothetical protein